MGTAPGGGQHKAPSCMLEISKTDEKLTGMFLNPTVIAKEIYYKTQEAIEPIAPVSLGCSQQRKQTPLL